MIQQEINAHIQHWDQMTREFKEARLRAGEDKEQWEHERGQFMRRLMLSEERATKAAAEVAADADDHLHELKLVAVQSEAAMESIKRRLEWCRGKNDALRSAKVDEREANRLYAENPAVA